jgi:hypothetical protein
MNERIKELAEHCDFYVGNEHYDKSHEEQQRLFMEKFAELIVRECSRIADGWVDNDDDGKNYPSEMIKQHFGVER